MVFESIIDPFGAKKHPLKLFFIGILFASIAVVFSLWIFREQASLIMVFITVIASIPLMYATLKEEEKEDIREKDEGRILKEHARAITFLTFMFLGFVVGYALWYIFLPAEVVEEVFDLQLSTIKDINSAVGGVGGFTGMETFFAVFGNNLKVLLFCILFAFFFGAGSIFILAWNASVISAAVGSYIREGLAEYVGMLGFGKLAVYFHLFAAGLLRYMLHGVFEVVGYFVGGLAGGIISFGLIRHGFRGERFTKVLYDSLLLMLIAIGFLIVGGVVEVYVTPLLF